MEKGGKAQRRTPPPPPQPSASARACVVLASCLRHACCGGKTTWAPLPPPHTPAPPRVGDAGRGGRKAAPPRGQRGRVGRQRREGAGRTTRPSPKRARAVQAPAGGPPGVRTQGRKGDDGSHKACSPPLQRDRCRASCLRRACVVPATCVQRREDDKPPPPTHTSAPPRVGDEGREGRTAPPPPLRTKRQGGEAAERGCGTDHTTVPEGSTRRASPSGGGTVGANAG